MELTSEQKKVLAALAVIAVLLVAIIWVAGSGTAASSTAIGLAALGGLGMMLWKKQGTKNRTQPPPQPPAQSTQMLQPPAPQRFPVRDVMLNSAREDYQFSFSCTVLWQPLPNSPGLPHTNPGALAAELILEEAEKLASTIAPGDAARGQYQLTSALGTVRSDKGGQIQVWAENIQLALPEKDAERLARLAEVRKQEEVWEYERNYERNVRSYLQEEVLADPATALVWWLAGTRSDEKKRVGEAVQQIDNIRRLVDVVNPNHTAPVVGPGHAALRPTPPDFTDDSAPSSTTPQDFTGAHPFVIKPTPSESLFSPPAESPLDHARALVENQPEGPERDMFTRRLADLLERHGDAEVAENLRGQFDAPQPLAEETSEQEAEQPGDQSPQPSDWASTASMSPVVTTNGAEANESGAEPGETEQQAAEQPRTPEFEPTENISDFFGNNSTHPSQN